MSSARKLRRASLQRGSLRSRRTPSTFEIVYGPLRLYAWQNEEVNAVVQRLHDLAQTSPREAIPELREWIERRPDVPVFYNYLAAAYLEVGENERADEVIADNYRHNPDYLFARINHAEVRLRDRDLEGAAKALGGDFDLLALYPGRRKFHISEFTGFTYAVALYHLMAGDREAARDSYELLRQVAPDDRSTEDLYHRLHPLRSLFHRG